MAISFQQNKKKTQLFNQRAADYWHFPVALLFAFCLMCLDRSHLIAPVHRVFASVASPFQYIVDTPGRIARWSRGVWGSKQALLHETKALHQEQLALKVRLQQFAALEKENDVLKNLLALTKETQYPTRAARVLAFQAMPTRHLLVINKGKKDGVTSGQLVLDTRGVTGQVIDVGLFTSTVLLISDAASAVPVRNQNTGETAILSGTNTLERLSLNYLPKTAHVKPGDVLVTSGLGLRYPAGYPVGVVEAVDNPAGEAFIRVVVVYCSV